MLALPDEFADLSSAQQATQAARIVRIHFHETRGKLPVWESIPGYRLQRTFDHAMVLNVDGSIQEGFNREPEPQATTLTIKGKRVPVGVIVGE